MIFRKYNTAEGGGVIFSTSVVNYEKHPSENKGIET